MASARGMKMASAPPGRKESSLKILLQDTGVYRFQGLGGFKMQDCIGLVMAWEIDGMTLVFVAASSVCQHSRTEQPCKKA